MRLERYLLAAFLVAMSAPLHSARADDRLNGTWAVDPASCGDVFTNRNGRPAFKRNSMDGAAGLIVSGKQMRGPRATCDLKSSKQQGEVLTLLLGCTSQIMFDTITVSVRFEGPDKLVRFDPAFSEITTTYNRCSR